MPTRGSRCAPLLKPLRHWACTQRVLWPAGGGGHRCSASSRAAGCRPSETTQTSHVSFHTEGWARASVRQAGRSGGSELQRRQAFVACHSTADCCHIAANRCGRRPAHGLGSGGAAGGWQPHPKVVVAHASASFALFLPALPTVCCSSNEEPPPPRLPASGSVAWRPAPQPAPRRA